jgi:hypothetical protein
MHDMSSVFSYSQTALTGDDISYFGASRQAPPAHVPELWLFIVYQNVS